MRPSIALILFLVDSNGERVTAGCESLIIQMRYENRVYLCKQSSTPLLVIFHVMFLKDVFFPNWYLYLGHLCVFVSDFFVLVICLKNIYDLLDPPHTVLHMK